jgi:protein-tyrosine phosphatase
VRAADFARFDHILAMDRSNLRDLVHLAPAEHLSKIRLLRQYDPLGGGDVPDPYYGGPEGFDEVVTIVERSCAGLLATLQGE